MTTDPQACWFGLIFGLFLLATMFGLLSLANHLFGDSILVALCGAATSIAAIILLNRIVERLKT